MPARGGAERALGPDRAPARGADLDPGARHREWFAVLAERVRAGTLRVSAPRSRSAASGPAKSRPALPEVAAETESNAAQPPPERLPKDFAWLVRLAGSEAVCYGGHLAHLLRDPEMVALLAASPQIVRLLRPLCRALGVDPSLLPPRPPRAARPPRSCASGGTEDAASPSVRASRRTRGDRPPAPRPERRSSTAADDEARARHYPVSLWSRRPA